MSVTEESLSHIRWECKYHVLFTPKYRKKTTLYELGKVPGERFREFAARKKGRIPRGGYVMVDHVHIPVAILLKHGVLQVVEYIKGKDVI